MRGHAHLKKLHIGGPVDCTEGYHLNPGYVVTGVLHSPPEKGDMTVGAPHLAIAWHEPLWQSRERLIKLAFPAFVPPSVTA